MKLKHCALLTAILICTLNACSSSDDEPGKITLPEDQSTSLTIPANQTDEQIHFTAAAAWSAHTSAESRSSDDVEWIHLDNTQGAAGDVVINISLDINNTGKDRTAYIIIICEDIKIVITITQTTDEDPDIPSALGDGYVEIEVNHYEGMNGMGYELDCTTTYKLEYVAGFPMRMISQWRDDLASYYDDSYCLNLETTEFNWNGTAPSTSTEVLVNISAVATYYPSLREEIEDDSQHFAKIENGRVVSGWYKWPEDRLKTNWTATYDNNGFLISSKNDDGDGSGEWSTHTMTWENGNLTKITCTEGNVITITYADASLMNWHHEFDINWVLPMELECYDFAAGDITKVFASTGLMGNSSGMLITAISEYDGKDTYSYRMNYSTNNEEETKVTVMHFVNDVQTSYSEWEITFSGNIK